MNNHLSKILTSVIFCVSLANCGGGGGGSEEQGDTPEEDDKFYYFPYEFNVHQEGHENANGEDVIVKSTSYGDGAFDIDPATSSVEITYDDNECMTETNSQAKATFSDYEEHQWNCSSYQDLDDQGYNFRLLFTKGESDSCLALKAISYGESHCNGSSPSVNNSPTTSVYMINFYVTADSPTETRITSFLNRYDNSELTFFGTLHLEGYLSPSEPNGIIRSEYFFLPPHDYGFGAGMWTTITSPPSGTYDIRAIVTRWDGTVLINQTTPYTIP